MIICRYPIVALEWSYTATHTVRSDRYTDTLIKWKEFITTGIVLGRFV